MRLPYIISISIQIVFEAVSMKAEDFVQLIKQLPPHLQFATLCALHYEYYIRPYLLKTTCGLVIVVGILLMIFPRVAGLVPLLVLLFSTGCLWLYSRDDSWSWRVSEKIASCKFIRRLFG
jgi:hypothetical protein